MKMICMVKLNRLTKFSNLVFYSILITIFSCNDGPSSLASIETLKASEITQISAKSGGNIISDGEGEITGRGVCWNLDFNPTISNNKTLDGTGGGTFISTLTDLQTGTKYYYRAYATNLTGTAYGNEETLTTASSDPLPDNQIIANHTIVDRFDDIPAGYLAEVKKMWMVYAGQSHSEGVRDGLALLESSYPTYNVNVTSSGSPEGYTTSHLRASRATWGSYNNSSGWIYGYMGLDWWFDATSISRTEAGISYCKNNNLTIGAFGYGWSWDMVGHGNPSSGTDPVYGCHWYGWTQNGPDGDRSWGINDADNTVTGNSLNLDDYITATQAYVDYCAVNGIATKVFFGTAPQDNVEGYAPNESIYQGHIKNEYIRDYVKADPTRILFDYADILAYDNNGIPTTMTWNGHTFPYITNTNLNPVLASCHISQTGTIRLAKAMWWMLARIAGWDGK